MGGKKTFLLSAVHPSGAGWSLPYNLTPLKPAAWQLAGPQPPLPGLFWLIAEGFAFT